MGDPIPETKAFDDKKESTSMSSSAEQPPSSPTMGAEEPDVESNKRSERKRRREKQRRSDLSNAFDELAAFIVQVEPGSGEDDMDKKNKKRKSSDGGEDSAGITRLDLIGRALRIMKRLYRENEERKRVISSLEGRGGGPNDNVIVMVPTLAPSGEDPQPVARAAYPGSYHHSGASPYYASTASVLPGSATGHDPREYSMPPPHHPAYASHWGAAANGYGGRSAQPPAGLTHHLHPPGTAVRLAHQHIPGKPPGTGPNGLPISYLPPGN